MLIASPCEMDHRGEPLLSHHSVPERVGLIEGDQAALFTGAEHSSPDGDPWAHDGPSFSSLDGDQVRVTERDPVFGGTRPRLVGGGRALGDVVWERCCAQGTPMLYTVTGPSEQAKHVRFHSSAEKARAWAGHRPDCHVYVVAAVFDSQTRCLFPLVSSPDPEVGPDWSTPAQPHGDGSITARGPIPQSLYLVALSQYSSSPHSKPARMSDW